MFRLVVLAPALIVGVLASGAISYSLSRVAHGLCLTLNGPGTTVLVPGRGC